MISVILCPFTPLAGCGAVAVLPVRCWPMAIVLIEPEHAAGRCAKAPAELRNAVPEYATYGSAQPLHGRPFVWHDCGMFVDSSPYQRGCSRRLYPASPYTVGRVWGCNHAATPWLALWPPCRYKSLSAQQGDALRRLLGPTWSARVRDAWECVVAGMEGLESTTN